VRFDLPKHGCNPGGGREGGLAGGPCTARSLAKFILVPHPRVTNTAPRAIAHRAEIHAWVLTE